MKNSIKQLSKDSFIYGISNFVRKGIGFFLLPIYTRYLTPIEYGQLELLTITATILTIITVQGMTNALFRFYPFYETEQQRRESISTSFYYLVFSALIICGIVFLFAEQFSEIVYEKDDLFPKFTKLIAVTVFFQILSIIFFQLYRVRLQSLKFVTISICSFILQVCLNIYFVVGLKLAVLGILVGNLINVFILFIVNIWISRKDLNLCFSTEKCKELLYFGLPLILVSISNWMLQIVDRIMLQKLSTTYELGLYSLGNRFGNILSFLIVTPFSLAWGAYCFQIATRENARAIFSRITTFWFYTLGLLAVLFIVFSPPLLKIMTNKSFWEAEKVIYPLILTTVVYGMYIIFNLGINIAKKTKYIAFIVSIGAILNFVLNMIFIPYFGMIGAAYASLFSYSVIMTLSYIISQKTYYIPFANRRLIKIAGLLLFLSYLSTVLHFSNFIGDILFRMILVLLFVPVSFLIKIFNKQDLLPLKKVFLEIKKKEGLRKKILYCYSTIKP